MSIFKWIEKDITIKAGKQFVYNTANSNTNMIQIVNRLSSGGGNVFADTRSDLTTSINALRTDQGKTGSLVRPYALRTVYLVSDAVTDLRVSIIEIETKDLSVVFNASQVLQIQGSVQVQDPIEVANDAGNPIPVSTPAGQYLNVLESFSYRHIAGAATTTIKTGAGTLSRLAINTKGTTATATIYDSTTGSGTVIAVVDLTAGVTSLIYDVAFTTGLTIVTTGTLSDITVTYK